MKSFTGVFDEFYEMEGLWHLASLIYWQTSGEARKLQMTCVANEATCAIFSNIFERERFIN